LTSLCIGSHGEKGPVSFLWLFQGSYDGIYLYIYRYLYVCGTKKEFVDDTAEVPPLGSVGASEKVAARKLAPRGGVTGPQGITANRAQAGQLEV